RQAFDSAVHARHHRQDGEDDLHRRHQSPGVRRWSGTVGVDASDPGRGDGDHRDQREPDAVDAAVAALRAGALVLTPTETVYGLAADAANPAAVAAIYEAKGRPRFNPLIAHVANAEAAERQAVFDDRALRLAAAFWPGPLTLVLPVRESGSICDLAR